ncbi:hypothetical protein D9M72_521880 [compost metagenome]
MLKRIDAALHHFRHFIKRAFAPAGDCHVEGIVGAGLACLLEPFLQRIEQVAFRARQHEIHNHRRAASKGCGGASVEIIG